MGTSDKGRANEGAQLLSWSKFCQPRLIDQEALAHNRTDRP
jgi:hypothetical protein